MRRVVPFVFVVLVSLGGVFLSAQQSSRPATTVAPLPGETRLRYRLMCRAPEQLPKRHLPQHRPGFVLDTPSGTLRIQATSPSPSQIALSIDEYSTPVATPRLVD